MDSSANDQLSIGINVEYIGDTHLSGLGLELPLSSDFSQDFSYLSPGWRSPQLAPSDSGSEYSNSPLSSPLIEASEVYTEQPTGFLDPALDALPHLSLHTNFYNLQDAGAPRSSTSLSYPDSPGSSSHISPADSLFPFPPSPLLSSSQTSLHSSGHSENSSPVKYTDFSSGLSPYSPYDAPSSPYSFTSSSAQETLFLTSGSLDSVYNVSSPPSPSPSHPPLSPLHLPKPSLSLMPEVTDVIAEVAEGQSSVDAEIVRHRLLETLSPTGDHIAGELKTLFSKNAKSSVSTDAGRAAAELRRKHPARFACQFTGCRSTFTRKLGLENHHKSHLGITDQECEFCSKRFPNSLPRHMKRCKDNPNRITTRKSKKRTSAADSVSVR